MFSSLTLQEEEQEEEVSDCNSVRITDEVRPGPRPQILVSSGPL